MIDDAVRRQKLIERLNVVVSNIAIAEKRVVEASLKHDKMVNDAKAQLGTASQQLDVAQLAYYDVRKKLLAIVPEHMGELPNIHTGRNACPERETP